MTAPIRSGYAGKRTLDLVVLALAAIPTLVMGAVCAALVKLTSSGPILFRQERIGMGGEPFEVLKFRTMIHAPEGNPIFPDPSRITAVGRWLRRLSLDELPQLMNVVRGEMSIVGPRPSLPYQVQRYTDEQRQRLDAKPGLTGLATIRGRNAAPWAERIRHDIEYVERQSLLLDLSILLRTVPLIVTGSGVEGHPTDDPLAVPPTDERP